MKQTTKWWIAFLATFILAQTTTGILNGLIVVCSVLSSFILGIVVTAEAYCLKVKK